MNTTISHEDRLAAAICHASILIPLLGISIPIGVLISERNRPGFLKFHAKQALAVDLIPVIGMFLYYFLMFLSMFIMMGAFLLGMLTATNGSSQEVSQAGGIIILLGFAVFFITMMLFNGVFSIMIPIVGIIALIAAWLTLKGRNFRYPILTSIIERRASTSVVPAG